ncbi:MAG: protein kinase [Planctomycetota bacterium]
MQFANFEFNPETDKLGEGPSSEVYRAVDSRLGRTVALKILRPHVEFDPSAKERFQREAKHTSDLAHPNIATVFEYGQEQGTSFIAMEYLEGRTLDEILKERTLDWEEGLRIAQQVAQALALVHQRNLVHRDLKPANVMVLPDGNVKLLDFGICRSTQDPSITHEGLMIGTVLYMAPEQVLGEEVSHHSDVFAFGSVFYHAFTGHLPFPGKAFPEACMAILEARPTPPSEHRSGFPESLERLLLMCLSRDAAGRFPNGGALAGALEAVSDSLRLSSLRATRDLRGGLVLAPIESPDGADELFASGVRRDLFSELKRSTALEIELPERGEELRDLGQRFLIRSTLAVDGTAARLDWTLERGRAGKQHETRRLYYEHIEHVDQDEWGLQAKLVGSISRSLKRRLTEFTLAPPEERPREPERALTLARQAHDVLHQGTSRHLISAIGVFRQALEADPACALAHAGLAEALVHKFMHWDGDRTFLDEARQTAYRALAHDPACAEAHTALGFAHSMVGDTVNAQREYRLAIQIDHDEWLAHRLLGAQLARTGNYEGASPLLQRAIALRPDHIASYEHLYGVLSRLDRYQEAIALADRAMSRAKKHLESTPNDQSARMHLALLQARIGLADESREMVAHAPRDSFTCLHASTVHALLGETERALALLQEAQERGYYLSSELFRSSDFEQLRGLPEFERLVR